MICYHCKKKIPDDVKYCPECGTATKLVGAALTQTIILPEDFEELEPAPAPVKPERKIELPKLKKEKSAQEETEEIPQEPKPPKQKDPNEPKAQFTLPIVAGIMFVVVLIALVFGIRGGSSDGAASSGAVSSGVTEPVAPIEFTDAALWHVERNADFPFTHDYDAETFDGFSLQYYGQIYMDADEAAALFEEYIDTYLIKEQGYEQTGEKMIDMEGLAWQFVWFEHPDEAVDGFQIRKMTEGLADGTCDLAYAFQGGIDGSVLVSCYYSADLTMRVGELPAVVPLQPRTPFTDAALWFAEANNADQLWRIGNPAVKPASFKQTFGIAGTNARSAARVLERYFNRSLTAAQDFEMVDSKTYEDDEVELGFYWFDYTGNQEIEGFQYKNHTADFIVKDCDLVYGYYDYGGGDVVVFSYYSRGFAPRSSNLLEIAEPEAGNTATAEQEAADETLDPLIIPAGAVPDLNAYSGGRMQLVNTITDPTYTKLEYEWSDDLGIWDEYMDLLQENYNFRLVDWDVDEQRDRDSYLYRLVYTGDANVESFESGFESVNLVIQYQTEDDGGAIQVTYASGLQYMDTADRGQTRNFPYWWF